LCGRSIIFPTEAGRTAARDLAQGLWRAICISSIALARQLSILLLVIDLALFEQVRELSLKLNGPWPNDPAPISIIFVGLDKEHATYRPNGFAAAFFGPIGDRDYIIIADMGNCPLFSTRGQTRLTPSHRTTSSEYPVPGIGVNSRPAA
jgi:hypothetical protein